MKNPLSAASVVSAAATTQKEGDGKESAFSVIEAIGFEDLVCAAEVFCFFVCEKAVKLSFLRLDYYLIPPVSVILLLNGGRVKNTSITVVSFVLRFHFPTSSGFHKVLVLRNCILLYFSFFLSFLLCPATALFSFFGHCLCVVVLRGRGACPVVIVVGWEKFQAVESLMCIALDRHASSREEAPLTLRLSRTLGEMRDGLARQRGRSGGKQHSVNIIEDVCRWAGEASECS